jgi:hypothetical protein
MALKSLSVVELLGDSLRDDVSSVDTAFHHSLIL